MRRTLFALGAAAVATALIFGAGRSLFPGSARTELPNGSAASPGEAQGAPAQASPAAAAAVPFVPGPNAARVSLEVRASERAAQGYVLSVHLAAPDGRALNEAPVRYYEIVELFGQREMLIGSSTTDGQGDGSLLYLPARVGPHEIVARSAGRAQVTRGEARVTFDAAVAAPAYRQEPPPLAAFSDRLPYGVGVVVLAVWALIAFALFGTARGVIGAARSDTHVRKGDTA